MGCKPQDGDFRIFRFARRLMPPPQVLASLTPWELQKCPPTPELMKMYEESKVPPPDVHGGHPFLLKLVLAPNHPSGERGVSIRDRQKHLFAWIREEDQSGDLFDALASLCTASRSSVSEFEESKAYRWAKREDDWHVSICLERAPEGETKW